ncbi:MAG: tRNA uridine(34) 5-carboxymethylaminomethyl modification radical SAM/GNAT enzyme Elp3 [Myxococcales bacterium]|nr:tRNA uridine(34) 5-carboxymethylaminomethyl modification radical SAM/GNAT enzyme Elp3 [Myxococcales bacterium]
MEVFIQMDYSVLSSVLKPPRHDPMTYPLTNHDYDRYSGLVRAIVHDIAEVDVLDYPRLDVILRRHSLPEGGCFSKRMVLQVYRKLCADGMMELDPTIVEKLQTKKTRTISGVAPVTVLTKPHPCPGKCIFCPTDVRLPKSYVDDEPGVQRALRRDFDPFQQVHDRIHAFNRNGHATDKIELLILGGTWSSYPRSYQEWFIQRCMDAMNGFEQEEESESLAQAHAINETATHRNVGLVIETRPDHISPKEIRWLRGLGVTKIQMGIQSLDDRILDMNNRGHSVAQAQTAMNMMRAAGFKVVLHWMPNLYGATPESDYEDFQRLFDDPNFRPDELKIYPCSLLENAELYEYWEKGKWQPYGDAELFDLVARCKKHVEPYCRINRVFRDIPAQHIVTGCTKGNLREHVRWLMEERGESCRCIRCKETRGATINADELALRVIEYDGGQSDEQFLAFRLPDERIAGYLRLSMPRDDQSFDLGVDALKDAALVREVHVYGRALALGVKGESTAQHLGLGTQLLQEAEKRSRDAGYRRLAIIASVGTRGYYGDRGYHLDGTYMVRDL